ncbi:hypothetical protein L1987_04549 [Smallanthus sonchifolius]|uniref:Uncharacterized protein n=1 Tax=Smallanthus sonchifolius TaxID=185202 RepID=A0ACB9JSW0_9ASTR|nr:hypothetical protein L1987_04549 [Smallanthus sonchifolius]
MEKQKTFTNEGNGIPQAWNPIFGMGIQDSEVNCRSEQLPNCFFNQRDLFESALSSIVSSPANSHPGIQISGAGENFVLRELIGRLGSLCNSGEISPQSHINGNNSSNNSCYNTPLNSAQKIHGNHQLPLAPRFSTFGGKNEFTHVMESGKLSRVSSNQSFKTAGSQFTRIPEENKKFSKLSMELGDSMEESSVSETGIGIGIKGQSTNNTNGRKRKGKETQSCTTICAKDDKVVVEVEKEESDAKRSKSNEKSTEPLKDYIHVRARRGQATDSHSLAERVRREKISERMKFLQDLVPGCDKVTGKAVMLDEIINYVQSLQKQVEFLSMKLATVNPRMDASMEAVLSKDMFRPQVSMPGNMNHFDTSIQSFPYGFPSQINGMVPDRPENQFSMNPLMAAMHRSSIIKPSHIDGFGEASTFWENDLQSVVKMALGQDQPQGFLGQMKVEL